MLPHEVTVSHAAAERYEHSRTLATRYIKEVQLQGDAWLWAVWFLFNDQQCGTPCPYWPEICFVGSDVCLNCPGCEGIQIITAHSGRVFCKNKKADLKPMPDCYFLPEGSERLSLPSQLPTELCPW